MPNASRGLPKPMIEQEPEWEEPLPDWITERLEERWDRELGQRPVARIIYFGDRPYYSVRQIRTALKQEFDPDTVRDRLNELTEQGILRKDRVNSGDVFYLKSEKSDWPIPPDTTVEPNNQEMTVSEFFNQRHVSIILAGILGLSLGAVAILLGVFHIEDVIPIPLFGESLLPSGLTVALLSIFVLVVGLVVWVYQKGVGDPEKATQLLESD